MQALIVRSEVSKGGVKVELAQPPASAQPTPSMPAGRDQERPPQRGEAQVNCDRGDRARCGELPQNRGEPLCHGPWVCGSPSDRAGAAALQGEAPTTAHFHRDFHPHHRLSINKRPLIRRFNNPTPHSSQDEPAAISHVGDPNET
ncbi:unnamed protein product [Lota lota]